MSYTDDELETGLLSIAEEIARLLFNFEKATGHQIVAIPIYRDISGNVGCTPQIIIQSSATVLKKGMDS